MVEKNPEYHSLPKNDNLLQLYKEIKQFKKKNPKVSLEVVVKNFKSRIIEAHNTNMTTSGTISISGYDIGGTRLTGAELALIVAIPANAYVTKQCSDKAQQYTGGTPPSHEGEF